MCFVLLGFIVTNFYGKINYDDDDDDDDEVTSGSSLAAGACEAQ